MKPIVWLLALGALAVGCSSDGDRSSYSSLSTTAGAKGVTGGDFHSLVADPAQDGRLYVGGHSHVARSDDGGKTWSSVDVLDDADAMGWSITEEAIWVSGHPGLKVSRDGETTFQHQNDTLPVTDVHTSGASSDRLYAAGLGLGVAGSSDGGRTGRIAAESMLLVTGSGAKDLLRRLRRARRR